MKRIYIIQLNRKYFWEDLVSYSSKDFALRSLFKLRVDNPKLHVRCIEVLKLC